MTYIPRIPPNYRPNYTWARYMLNDWGTTGVGPLNDRWTGLPLSDLAALTTVAEGQPTPRGVAQREVAQNPSRIRDRLRARLGTQSPRVGVAVPPGSPLAPVGHLVQWIRELGYPSSVQHGKIYVSRETVRQFQKDWNAVVQRSPLPDTAFQGGRRPVTVNGLTNSQEMYAALGRARAIDQKANTSWKSVVALARLPQQRSNPICDKPWHTGKLDCEQTQYTYGDPKCKCEVKAQLKGIPYGPDTWGAKIAPQAPLRRARGGGPVRFLDTRRGNPPQNRMPSPQGPKGWISGCCLDASGTVRCKDTGRSVHGTNPEVINQWPNGYTVEIAPGLQKRILACPPQPGRQAAAAPAPARRPWRSPLAPTPSSASLRARAMARRGNPAMGMRGVCPPGTAYAGTFPAAMNAYTAICTDPRTGQVVSTFGTVRTFPGQHVAQSIYRG